LCPYCFNRFHLARAHRREVTGPSVPDAVVGRFLDPGGQIAPPMARASAPPRGHLLSRLWARVYTPGQDRQYVKVCPECHLALPTAAANGYPSHKVLALFGTRRSGKSNYFGVLLKQLQDRYAAEVGFSLWPQASFCVKSFADLSSRQLWWRRYGNYLYGAQPRVVPQTKRAVVDPDTRIPLLYRMDFPRSGWRSRQALDLVIFDAAGEDLRDVNPQTLRQFGRYLHHAAGIIFLIDPDQVEGLHERLVKALRDHPRQRPEDEDDLAFLLGQILSRFEEQKGYHPGRKIPVPTAFTFAKSDWLKALLGPAAPRLADDNHHDGGFDDDDSRQVAEEVQGALSRWGEGNFLQLIDDRFDDYRFFAVSALGQEPGPDGRLARPPIPCRVGDPLFWLLWRLGYICGRTG
jgi:hypothetical protein